MVSNVLENIIEQKCCSQLQRLVESPRDEVLVLYRWNKGRIHNRLARFLFLLQLNATNDIVVTAILRQPTSLMSRHGH